MSKGSDHFSNVITLVVPMFKGNFIIYNNLSEINQRKSTANAHLDTLYPIWQKERKGGKLSVRLQ